MEKFPQSKIKELLENQTVIGYTALPHEIDCELPLSGISHKSYTTTPNKKESDPFSWASQFIHMYTDKSVSVLIPGKQFDIHGTRHGQGGGWYDRFLSKVPSTWVRIGVCNESQLQIEPLTRESWDEPIDWIIVKTDDSWEVYKTDTRQTI